MIEKELIEKLRKKYSANSPEGMMMVHAFDSRFPNAEIPNLIKVGFIIWGERVGIANDL